MTAREWKPGDVAIAQHPIESREVRGIIDTDGRFYTTDRSVKGISSSAFALSNLRPLVVLDPENPTDVERMFSALRAKVGMGTISEALDSLVAPPQARGADRPGRRGRGRRRRALGSQPGHGRHLQVAQRRPGLAGLRQHRRRPHPQPGGGRMTTDAITRGEALFALATAPFVLVVLVAIAFAVGYVLGHERRNPYLDIVEKARNWGDQ